MENKYIEHLKCHECGAFKLIEDYEIMRVYSQAMIIRFKCTCCGFAQRSRYYKSNQYNT